MWPSSRMSITASLLHVKGLEVDFQDDPDQRADETARRLSKSFHSDGCFACSRCGMEKVKSMDSDQLEQERGITILAKNAAVNYKGIKVR